MIKHNCHDIFESSLKGNLPSREEIIELMKIDLDSPEFYALCYTANKMTREQFGNKADVCAQIGLDYTACQYNCKFCSFTEMAGLKKDEGLVLETEDVISVAREMVEAGASAVYLMSTGRYPMEKFIEVGEKVRAAISDNIPLAANTHDFNYQQALKMKEVGFTAVYHAVRMREGVDTEISVQRRLDSIENAKKAGLTVQVCLEPVGPEHSIEEMADQMIWAREIEAAFNGAMRRTGVPNTSLAKYGEISFRELALLVAVSRLAMGDRALNHCTHEPNIPSFCAGANLTWAEAGTNPRDIVKDTSQGRGKNVYYCSNLFAEAGFEVRKAASPACLSR